MYYVVHMLHVCTVLFAVLSKVTQQLLNYETPVMLLPLQR